MLRKRGEVVVIDDDPGIRQAVVRLLDAAGLDSRAFASAEEFLAAVPQPGVSVLILDIQLPGLSGLELLRRLLDSGHAPPAIFITGQDTPYHRKGAEILDSPCFTKPFAGIDLLDAVRERLPAA